MTRPLASFVVDLPYFLPARLIPPLAVMNEEFCRGEDDAGMSGGCVWESFEIDEEEHRELTAELQRRGYRYVEPPEWARTEREWHIWYSEFELGIPAQRHRRLVREEERWAALSKKAAAEGNEERAAEYWVTSLQAGQRLADLAARCIRRYQNQKRKRRRHGGRRRR